MPFVMPGVASDGSRLLMVWRRTSQGERWLAIMQLSSALWDGVLPENLDQEMLNKAIALIDRSTRYSCRLSVGLLERLSPS